ncbi:hypothetical protein D3C86_1022970 [compost metagenome]
MNSGSLNNSCASSFGTPSYNPLATCTSVSNPTTSTVLKVADFGRPITGPVNLSTSSIVSPNSFTWWNMLMIPKIPIRFPINAGVSFAMTDVLPKNFSPYSFKKSNTSVEVFGPGMISKSFKYRAGLKKCVPQKCFWKSSLLPSLIK